MWERSGGNAQMVDALVCAWNDRNPDRPINLEYIEHTDDGRPPGPRPGDAVTCPT